MIVQVTESRKVLAVVHYVPTGTDMIEKAVKFWNDPRVKTLAEEFGFFIEGVQKSKVRALERQ